jgi:hypothetical protein
MPKKRFSAEQFRDRPRHQARHIARNRDAFIERFVDHDVQDPGWLRARQLAFLRNRRSCRNIWLALFHPNRWLRLQQREHPM